MRLVLLIVVMVINLAASHAGAEPLRLAIVGLSHDHVFWLLHRDPEAGDIEIVGVYETDEDLARSRMRDANLDPSLLYTDLGSMIEHARPEAACLFGSIADHARHGLPLLEAGVHVMVEKPTALNVEEARTLADAAKRSGVHLLTNYETTWQLSMRHVGQAAREGDLGTVRRMVFRMGHPGPIEIGCREPFLEWLLDPAENGGGAVTDFGCYGANLAVWMQNGARPKAVTASLHTHKPSLYNEVDDDATITIEFEDSIAIVQASWCWPHHVKETRVYGDQADQMTVGADQVRTHRQDASATTDAANEMRGFETDPFAHLAAVVRLSKQPNELSSIENNLLVMEILDAARESAATGRRVELP